MVSIIASQTDLFQEFFFVCPAHLKDKAFCTPIIDEAAAAAKKKKEMEEEVERVRQEFEEKQKKKKKENDKEKDKKEKDDSKKDEKDEKAVVMTILHLESLHVDNDIRKLAVHLLRQKRSLEYLNLPGDQKPRVLVSSLY